MELTILVIIVCEKSLLMVRFICLLFTFICYLELSS